MDRLRQYAILGIVGGGLISLGSVLPWASISSGLGSVSVAGTEGDGVASLIGGLVVALASFVAYGGNRGMFATVAALGAAGVLFMGFELSNVLEAVEGAGSDFARASVGIGLWIGLAGALIATAGGVAGYRARSDEV